MATRRRGLGPQGEDPFGRRAHPEDNRGLIPSPDQPIEKTRLGERAVIPSGDDFGPYFLDEAPTYFQGPYRSTRVAAHQFIPIDDLSTADTLGNQFNAFTLRGYIYVRFIKNNTLWRYGPCTLHDYRIFRDSASKGRSVRSLEVFGHGLAPDSPSELEI